MKFFEKVRLFSEGFKKGWNENVATKTDTNIVDNDSNQTQDNELKDMFTPLANKLSENEKVIVDELNSVQGNPVDIGGYFLVDEEKTSNAMRPSKTFNKILEELI